MITLERGVNLHCRGVSKRFGTRHVLADLVLDIASGEFVAIVGKSGSGKSTLLRLIAGLETADSGEVRQDDTPVMGINPIARMMFQEARLLPWKTVLQNVRLGLERAEWGRADTVLAEVGLGDRLQDYPGVLSGGQKQRVALARALAAEPRLLLLDEPLGALDALTRWDMQQLLERVWLERKCTTILVTHDVEEAVALADRVVLLEEGGLVMDCPVRLTRPRAHDSGEFIALRTRILNHLLGTP